MDFRGNCGLWGGFPGGSEGKASAYNMGDPGSIPGSGRSPGEEPVKTGVRPYLRLSRPYTAHNRSRDLRNIGGI